MHLWIFTKMEMVLEDISHVSSCDWLNFKAFFTGFEKAFAGGLKKH